VSNTYAKPYLHTKPDIYTGTESDTYINPNVYTILQPIPLPNMGSLPCSLLLGNVYVHLDKRNFQRMVKRKSGCTIAIRFSVSRSHPLKAVVTY